MQQLSLRGSCFLKDPLLVQFCSYTGHSIWVDTLLTLYTLYVLGQRFLAWLQTISIPKKREDAFNALFVIQWTLCSSAMVFKWKFVWFKDIPWIFWLLAEASFIKTYISVSSPYLCGNILLAHSLLPLKERLQASCQENYAYISFQFTECLHLNVWNLLKINFERVG